MKTSLLCASATVLLLLQSVNAHAYIDPGTGSYMLQLIMAGVVGLVVTVKMYYHRIRATISRLFGGASKDTTPSDDD